MTSTIDTAPAETGADQPATERRHALRWWVLAVLGIAQLMVVLDATVVNIALPEAQRALTFSDADRQWVITGYALAFGSLLPLGGRLSDIFGRRNAFMTGLVGFAVASAIGGASTSFEMLVAARVGQGVFGALLAPAALALLTVTFTDASERAKAFGVFGAIGGMGAAVGLLLGGALTEWASWRWAMYVNLVFAGAALIGAAILLAKHVAQAQKPVLDIPGTVAATLGLFSVVYGFSKAESDGWTSGVTLSFLAAGALFLIGFVVLQTQVAHPLLPMRVVLDRMRGASYISIFTVGIGMFALFLFLTYYMQLIMEFSPIVTGVAFLPMVVTIILGSTTTPTLILSRIGTKATVGLAFAISAVGMALLTRLEVDSSYAGVLLPGIMVLGYGLGMIFSVAFQGSTAGVHHEDAGVASAMVNTVQQVGGSIGTALLSTIAASAITDFVAGKETSPLLAAQAQVHSYTTTFWWVTALLVIGGVIATAVFPNTLPQPAEGEPVLAH